MDSHGSRRPSVLVVDDTPANLQLLIGMLRDSGYRVRPVMSGAHALKAARAEPPDLILLDVTMPEMDGYEVCRRLKADPGTAEIPVLFISALADTQDKVRAFEAGGVDYVSKPFQFPEVLARVRTHLELRRQKLELQQTVATVRRLERLRDDLTHMIVHDMRSPLQAMALNVESLLEEPHPELEEPLSLIDESLRRLIEMVNDVLDVSRMEVGGMPTHPETVELVGLVRAVLSPLVSLAQSRDVQVAGQERVLAWADIDLIRRVIANLLCNAFKFARQSGRVTVRVLEQGGRARVEVEDDGPGIAEEHRVLVFEKFGQVAGAGTRSGSGLGLTFARLAVEASGGAIGVNSTLGQGSTFWFTLPLGTV